MALTREHMRKVLIEHVEAENDHAPDRVAATYSADAPVFEDVPAGVCYVGSGDIIANYRHLWDGFPGLKREITRWTFGDDSAVIELTLRGSHDGAYKGIPATGKDMELRVIAHFQFDAEGRIAQETAYYDTLTFMRQLGLSRP